MRPRHYAAENRAPRSTTATRSRCFNEAAALRRGKLHERLVQGALGRGASMRPRHYAAENKQAGEIVRLHQEASMRPRHYAAENKDDGQPLPQRDAASMRPRHYAAENITITIDEHETHCDASMRPRHYAAENAACTSERCRFTGELQ